MDDSVRDETYAPPQGMEQEAAAPSTSSLGQQLCVSQESSSEEEGDIYSIPMTHEQCENIRSRCVEQINKNNAKNLNEIKKNFINLASDQGYHCPSFPSKTPSKPKKEGIFGRKEGLWKEFLCFII